MHLNTIDVIVVIGYIILIYSIAFGAKRFMKKRFNGNEANSVVNHYLAGKTITFWEATLSIIATEFSALAFLIIPTYVYFENLSYLRFVIGACISRALISFFFIPYVYGKGLTIFEVLARGIHGYKVLRKDGQNGKKTFAFFYVVTKLVGVSVKLLGGALLLAEFFNTSLFTALAVVACMTYCYILVGGLKAVVRTDMLQATVFILGGLVAHYVIGQMSPYSWGELVSLGYKSGKFHLWEDGLGFANFFYGILAGIAYDAATHGVDQDLTQKLFGAESKETAQKALAWSALGSFFVNMTFLTLGVVLWAFYMKQGIPIPPPEKMFSDLIEFHFPSPLKGLMVASILAACMSSLDSSINAMSSVLWNDLLKIEKTKMPRLYINLDNFIITLGIVFVAYVFSLVPGAMKFGMQFAYLTTAPLLAFFLCRMMLSKYIQINFNPFLIMMSFGFTFLGMGINHFRLGFNPQLNILWGIVTTISFMWVYSKISTFFNTSESR
jgi:solute:Na+ symporter, SSS family